MKRPNPVFVEAVRGIAASKDAHFEYLFYLFLQSVVLFIWWPKDSLFEALEAGERPATLLASVIALGAATAWYSARAGAEEFRLPGQSRVGAWAVGTRLPLSRILAGYLGGHLAQTVGLVTLSLPLVLCGFSVSGGRWSAVGWCLMAVVFQATFFRLAAAAIHLAIGHQETMTLVCVRGTVVVAYLVGITLVPAASHVVLSIDLLDGHTPDSGLAHPAIHFIAWSCAASAAAALVLHHQLAGLRRAHPVTLG